MVRPTGVLPCSSRLPVATPVHINLLVVVANAVAVLSKNTLKNFPFLLYFDITQMLSSRFFGKEIGCIGVICLEGAQDLLQH